LFSLPVGTEMFHFPTFPPLALCVQARVTGHDSCRVSPFGNPRITARLAAPRGLSQPPTSFFGSWCQGIHRAPLLTWPQRCSRPLCSSQGTGDSAGFSAVHSDVRRRTSEPGGPERREELPSLQDPTACRGRLPTRLLFHSALLESRAVVLGGRCGHRPKVNVPPLSNHRGSIVHVMALGAGPVGLSARCSLERR
jgi:hypothetical protein